MHSVLHGTDVVRSAIRRFKSHLHPRCIEPFIAKMRFEPLDRRKDGICAVQNAVQHRLHNTLPQSVFLRFMQQIRLTKPMIHLET
ncbi:hypothetical protein RHMOL_Rhmol03G0158300 [Rhododendron molle]|uniref:Uncharacterized protein n=1 Tax=Rhododendron molle TaxID=49168 RepID=A0ACC0PG34_RHOML|nr:hypothetical protein RHMOL_Rhmol03G0158300 [Rhododendron molle]